MDNNTQPAADWKLGATSESPRLFRSALALVAAGAEMVYRAVMASPALPDASGSSILGKFFKRREQTAPAKAVPKSDQSKTGM
jgi:hypothetical protein